MENIRSYYILEFWVDPGGAREHDRWVLNCLEDVKKAFAVSMRKQFYLTVVYGRHIRLRVVQNSKTEQTINLSPLLTIETEGFPIIRFDREGNVSKDIAEILEDWDEDIWFDDFTFSVDWDAANIQPLEGKLLQKGEMTEIEDSDYSFDDYIKLGFLDIEVDGEYDSIEEAEAERFNF